MAKKPKMNTIMPLKTHKAGALRVWHIPQVPMKAFRVDVASVDEAKLVLKVLAEYDIFQFENKVKPDYCNAQGLEVLEDDGFGPPDWCEWNNENGDDIATVMRAEEA